MVLPILNERVVKDKLIAILQEKHASNANQTKLTTVEVTMNALAAANRAIKDWNTVIGTDLLAICPTRSRLDCLRRALRIWLGEALAKNQWPEFFAHKHARLIDAKNPKTPTQRSTLPPEVLRLSDDDGLRMLFEKLYKRFKDHTSMRTTMTMRVNMSFIYGFLFRGKGSLLPDVGGRSYDELIQTLKAFTHKDIVTAYEKYRDSGSRLKCGAISLGALSQHMYLVSLIFCDFLKAFSRRVKTSDFGIVDNKKRGAKRKRSQATGKYTNAETESTDGSTSAGLSIGLDRGEPLVNKAEKWKKETSNGAKIHCFAEPEVKKLYLACETDFEKIMLTMLFTTGMRIGGFCLTKLEGLIRENSGEINDVLLTTEKGNHSQDYDVATQLRPLLSKWIAEGRSGEHYLFTKKRNSLEPMSTREARRIFKKVASRAGITGKHVKPHTTRHTVAWTLHALGHSIAEVAFFVGHKCPNVTSEVYVAMDKARTRNMMTIPWMNKDPEEEKAKLMAEALALAGALAGPFGSADGKTFPKYCKQKGHTKPAASLRVRFQNSDQTSGSSATVNVDEAEHERVVEASVSRADAKAQRRSRKEEMDKRLFGVLENSEKSNQMAQQNLQAILEKLNGQKKP